MPINMTLLALCLVGFLLSAYAYSVELNWKRAMMLGIEHKAYCDVGPFSCTRVFSSVYGSLTQFVGLPPISNALLGMSYYLVEMLLCWHPTLIFSLSVLSLVVTTGFAYVLFAVLQDICVVCISTYMVNVLTVVVSYRWWKRTRQESHTKRKR